VPSLAYSNTQISATGGTLTSTSFTPNTNDIIVVKAISADSANGTFATPTGGGWTYIQQVSDLTASHCGVKLWTALVTTGGTSQTVSVVESGVEGHCQITVELWTGAKLAATPATVDSRGTGAPSTPLTTVLANSVVSWCNGDWAAVDGASRTYNTTSATPTEDGYNFVSTSYTGYSAYQTAVTAGSQTLGITAPTGQTWTLVGIEIQDNPVSGGKPIQPGKTWLRYFHHKQASYLPSPPISAPAAVIVPAVIRTPIRVTRTKSGKITTGIVVSVAIPSPIRTSLKPVLRPARGRITTGTIVTVISAPAPVKTPRIPFTRLARSKITAGTVVTVTVVPAPVVPDRIRTLRRPFVRTRSAGIVPGIAVTVATAPVPPVPARTTTRLRQTLRGQRSSIRPGIVVTVVPTPVVPNRIRTFKRPFTCGKSGQITAGIVVTVTTVPTPVVPAPIRTVRRPFTRIKSAGIRPAMIVTVPVVPDRVKTSRRPFTRIKSRGITPGLVVTIVIPPVVPARVKTRFRPHTKAISRSRITGELKPGVVVIVFFGTSVAGGTEQSKTQSGSGISTDSVVGGTQIG